jgi:hypothetical protein
MILKYFLDHKGILPPNHKVMFSHYDKSKGFTNINHSVINITGDNITLEGGNKQPFKTTTDQCSIDDSDIIMIIKK